MYSIDVNFLKDRSLGDAGKSATLTKAPRPTPEQQQPILVGLGVMVLLLLIPIASMFVLNWQTAQTEQKIAELNGELAKLNAKSQKLEEINKKLEAATTEVGALVTVFNQIKPVSAILQEISSQIPNSVQINAIQNSSNKITIEGYALNYDVVNDFLLTLQNSKFLDARQTKLIAAKTADLPINVGNSDNLAASNISVQFPQGVQYKIETTINNIPASQLLPDLARNGAVGLVTRLQTLEQKGAFKQ
jgi:type IV pilus assembly protein PilN